MTSLSPFHPVILSSFAGDLWRTIGLALGFARDLPQAVSAHAHPVRLALAVAVLAGLSQFVGDSNMLFFKRVRPLRFLAGWIWNSLYFVLGQVLLAVLFWLASYILFGTAISSLRLAVLIFWLGSVPLIFDFLRMASSLGRYPGYVVRAWSWLIIVLAVCDGFEFALWQALLALALGVLLAEALKSVLDRPLGTVTAWAWRLVTGARFEPSLAGQAALRLGQAQRAEALRLSEAVGARLFEDG